MISGGPQIGASDAGPPRTTRSRSRGLVQLAVIAACLAAILFGGGFLWFVRLMPTSEIVLNRKADGIVVLTGSALRINDALELLAAGHGQRLLISGVNPGTRSSEISRPSPEYQRWFNCCVDLDHFATNTIGNAVQTRLWAKARGFKSLIIVTSNFHMQRALSELARQLPDVELVPFPVVSDKIRVEAWWGNPSTARLLIGEYLKYIVSKTRTWLRISTD